jgi:hypothetical protein
MPRPTQAALGSFLGGDDDNDLLGGILSDDDANDNDFLGGIVEQFIGSGANFNFFDGFQMSAFGSGFDFDFSDLAETLDSVTKDLDGTLKLFSKEMSNVFLDIDKQYEAFFPSTFDFSVFAQVLGDLDVVDLTPELKELMAEAEKLAKELPSLKEGSDAAIAAAAAATRNANQMMDAMLDIGTFASELAGAGLGVAGVAAMQAAAELDGVFADILEGSDNLAEALGDTFSDASIVVVQEALARLDEVERNAVAAELVSNKSCDMMSAIVALPSVFSKHMRPSDSRVFVPPFTPPRKDFWIHLQAVVCPPSCMIRYRF